MLRNGRRAPPFQTQSPGDRNASGPLSPPHTGFSAWRSRSLTPRARCLLMWRVSFPRGSESLPEVDLVPGVQGSPRVALVSPWALTRERNRKPAARSPGDGSLNHTPVGRNAVGLPFRWPRSI